MATCPSCGKEYVPPAAFCPHCNAVLDKPDTAPPPVGTQPTLAGPANAGRGTGFTGPTTISAPILMPADVAPNFGDIGVYIVRRFLALVVDVAGVGLLIAIGLLALFERISTNVHPQTADGYRTFLIVVGIALFLYYWLFEGLLSTTLGKLLFGLGIVRDPDAPLGLGRALVRNLLRIADLALIGFILAAVTPRRKRLGDMLAGSTVVSHRMGAMAPVIAIVVLGGIGYLAYAYGNALERTRALVNSSQQFGPQMFQQSTPVEIVSPLPGPTATSGVSPSPSETPTASQTPSGASPSPIL